MPCIENSSTKDTNPLKQKLRKLNTKKKKNRRTPLRRIWVKSSKKIDKNDPICSINAYNHSHILLDYPAPGSVQILLVQLLVRLIRLKLLGSLVFGRFQQTLQNRKNSAHDYEHNQHHNTKNTNFQPRILTDPLLNPPHDSVAAGNSKFQSLRSHRRVIELVLPQLREKSSTLSHPFARALHLACNFNGVALNVGHIIAVAYQGRSGQIGTDVPFEDESNGGIYQFNRSGFLDSVGVGNRSERADHCRRTPSDVYFCLCVIPIYFQRRIDHL